MENWAKVISAIDNFNFPRTLSPENNVYIYMCVCVGNENVNHNNINSSQTHMAPAPQQRDATLRPSDDIAQYLVAQRQ